MKRKAQRYQNEDMGSIIWQPEQRGWDAEAGGLIWLEWTEITPWPLSMNWRGELRRETTFYNPNPYEDGTGIDQDIFSKWHERKYTLQQKESV